MRPNTPIRKVLITFEFQTTATDIVLCVRDTGIGLAPEMLGQVFEMFSQVAPEQSRTEGGLGIGLALVKGLVELHGGRIEARSAGLERGSEFLVFLPGVRVASGSLEQALSRRSAAADSASLRRILIADDNRDGAETLAMLLDAPGREIHLAHSGPEALQVAAAQRPQVVILDIGMPGMDGYQVAHAIRNEAWGIHMILIALTGWGQEGRQAARRACGLRSSLDEAGRSGGARGVAGACGRLSSVLCVSVHRTNPTAR